MQGRELGEGISLPLSWLRIRRSSRLPPCCSGVRLRVGVGDLCSPASPLHVFPLQLGVRDPAVLRAVPAEKVRTSTLSTCAAPWDGAWGAGRRCVSSLCSLTHKRYFCSFKQSEA